MKKKLNIGIILDGNRRYAQQRGNQPWEGHNKGAEKVEQLFTWITQLPIQTLTLYAWSMQNFGRTEIEKKFVFKIMENSLQRLSQKTKDLQKKGILVNFLGRLNLFPKKIQQKMQKIIDATKKNKKYTINFCMAYGGREEIVDAVAKTIKNKEKITEKNIQKNLYLAEEPDFIIRTSGEKRTSNFLMWQSTYSEWFFLDKYWPEIEKEDIAYCIATFYERNRRFGK